MIARGLGSRATGPHYARMIGLMTAFVVGADQSGANVEEIHSILLSRFASDGVYAEVIAATASFMPGGTAPFYDEARLEEAYRTFLTERNVFVPDAPQDQTGVWPPPPNPRRE